MIKENENIDVDVPPPIMQNWQSIVDIMAEIIGVPAGLIMRITEPYIEVFLASQSADNPYNPGDREPLWGSGLYCETVIKTKEKLLVPNALANKKWENNPDIKRKMISYLGFPILLPDGRPFGTICVIDNKENPYSKTYEQLILSLRELIQTHLELLYMNHKLGDKKKRMSDYLSELQALRGIIPICTHCKKLRDDKGQWHPVERYLYNHPEADFSHTCCPECMNKHYPDLFNDS